MARFFLAELSRSIRDNLTFAVLLVALVAVFQYWILVNWADPRELEEVGNIFVIAVVIFSAAIQGAATFPVEWRDRHWVQLFALPVSRDHIWLTALAARSTGVLAGLVSLLILRPSVRGDWYKGTAAHWVALSGILFFFLFGAALALLVRQRVLLYVTVALLGCPIFSYLLIASAHLTRKPFQHPIGHFLGKDQQPDIGLFAAHLGLVCLALLGFSRLVFVHGEYNNRLRRLRRGGQGLLLLLGLSVLLGLGVVTRIYTLILPASSVSGLVTVSPDGSFVARFFSAANRPRWTAMEIQDLTNGRRIARLVRRGIEVLYIRWSDRSNAVYFMTEENSFLVHLGLERPLATLWGLSLDGREERVSEGVVEFKIVPGEGILVVREDEWESRAELYDEITRTASIVEGSSMPMGSYKADEDVGEWWVSGYRDVCPKGAVVLRPGSRLLVLFDESKAIRTINLPNGNWLVVDHGKGAECRPLLPFLVERFGVPRVGFEGLQGVYFLAGPCPVFDPAVDNLLFAWRHKEKNIWGLHRFDRRCACWRELTGSSSVESPFSHFDFDESVLISSQGWAERLRGFETITERHHQPLSDIVLVDDYIIHSLGGRDIEALGRDSAWVLGARSDYSFWLLESSFMMEVAAEVGPLIYLRCRDHQLRGEACFDRLIRLGEQGPEELAKGPRRERDEGWERVFVDEAGRQYFRNDHESIEVYDHEGQLIREILFVETP